MSFLQQAVLIRQLQEQHYQQYMQQVLQEQLGVTECNQMNHKTEPVNNMTTEVENPQDGSQESSNEAEEEDICGIFLLIFYMHF